MANAIGNAYISHLEKKSSTKPIFTKVINPDIKNDIISAIKNANIT